MCKIQPLFDLAVNHKRERERESTTTVTTMTASSAFRLISLLWLLVAAAKAQLQPYHGILDAGALDHGPIREDALISEQCYQELQAFIEAKADISNAPFWALKSEYACFARHIIRYNSYKLANMTTISTTSHSSLPQCGSPTAAGPATPCRRATVTAWAPTTPAWRWATATTRASGRRRRRRPSPASTAT